MELPLKTSHIIVQGSISSMTSMIDMSASSNITATTTTEFLLGEFMVNNVAAWVNLAILMLGLITNPLILIVLRKNSVHVKLTSNVLRRKLEVSFTCTSTPFLYHTW